MLQRCRAPAGSSSEAHVAKKRMGFEFWSGASGLSNRHLSVSDLGYCTYTEADHFRTVTKIALGGYLCSAFSSFGPGGGVPHLAELEERDLVAVRIAHIGAVEHIWNTLPRFAVAGGA